MQVLNFSFSLYNRTIMDEKKIELKNHRRHVRVWRFARVVFRPILKSMFGYSGEQAPKNLKGPYIVLSNHNSNIDPIMIGTSFRQQMYFIASEQVYRWGFKSALLKRYFEPISKIKGARDVLAITKALRKVKSGYNICLFPEGNRSFNGKTWPVLEATGKLIKVSGAGLVTYRLEGEYLAFPRWMTGKARKGKINGRFMHYYSPEELKAMSVQEITKHISDDIQENAFEYQEKNMIRYKGKNLAEGMECAVCVCPKCHGIDVIKTSGNSVSCKNCGHLTDYSEYGFFDDNFNFKNITLWDEWQTEFYKKYIEENEGVQKPLFTDSRCTLSAISDDHSVVPVGVSEKGEVTDFKFYKDRIEFSNLTVRLEDINACSIFDRDTFCFSDRTGTHYELVSDELKNFRKYTSALQILCGLN